MACNEHEGHSAAITRKELDVMFEDFKAKSSPKNYLRKNGPELKAFMESQAGRSLSDDEVKEFIGSMFDKNDDDKIYFDEWCTSIHQVEWLEICEEEEDGTDVSAMSFDDRWKRIFDKHAFEDGKLDKAEFRRIKRLIKARNATSRAPDGKRIIDQVFKDVDLNNDGHISFTEFMKMINDWKTCLPAAGSEMMHEHALIALERVSKKSDLILVDTRNGKLTAAEKELVMYLFKRADKDNSGWLSYREFKTFRHEFYMDVSAETIVEEVFEADKNSDDQLTVDEWVTVFKALKFNLAKHNLGGKFFLTHLEDLCVSVWDHANDEAGEPPVVQEIATYNQGAIWHTIGGKSAVQAEQAESRVKLDAYETKSKMKKVKKHDDFNFSKIFAARQAGYTGVVRFG